MFRLFVVTVATIVAAGSTWAADAKDATAVLDKAIKALGGEEKLGKVAAFSYSTKGSLSIMGNDAEVRYKFVFKGIDHYRQEFEGDLGGDKLSNLTVVAGDKGWRKFGDMGSELEGDMLANQKRAIYLWVVPVTVLPLKGKGFKTELAGEEKVNDKPAVGVKATVPDGRDFTIFFDKESGLPVKMVAKVVGFGGKDVTQEWVYSDYKEVGGIQKATKVEAKRDGQKFYTQEVSDFKVLDKVDAKTFAKPE
jgi:hypothetical protein